MQNCNSNYNLLGRNCNALPISIKR